MQVSSYRNLIDFIRRFDVAQYARSRNYYSGQVSRLSPYISRGVISLNRIRQIVSEHHSFEKAKSFISELAWREYFQRMWWKHGDRILDDFYRPQEPVLHHRMICSVAEGATGLNAIDVPIRQLIATGYMHNHARMYVASLACNIGQAHWLNPSRWMYYHLLDGDIASNSLSWQWVAGTFSSKKYYFNQENLNRFSETIQTGTFMDCGYDKLSTLPVPAPLFQTVDLSLTCKLPETAPPELDASLPLLIYNSYNLDPAWRSNIAANRILLLEPSHFNSFPVSATVLNFIINTARKWVPGIQVFTGEFGEIPGLAHFPHVYFKDHPVSRHYRGERDTAEWMFPEVEPAGSFSAYWKACEKRTARHVT